MRRFSFIASLGSLSTLGLVALARGQYQPPAGYEEIPLVDSSNQPLTPEGLAVSPDGEMAVTNGNTVTLYNTWQNGRMVIGTVTNSAWMYDTDPVFLNDSTVLFVENGNTDALWSVSFSTTTSTQMTATGSLPFVEGVTVLNPTHALVSGQIPSPTTFAGGLYLDRVDLTKTSGNVSSVVTNVGSGYPGNPAVTPGGNLVLLEGLSSSGSAFAHVYTPDGASIADDALDNGNGLGEAYGIAFDSAGNGYITTDNTITMITGIDSAAPLVSEFGSDDSPNQFLTSISYTDGAFNAGEAGDTGALIVNDGDEGGAFAIVVPEPASIGMIGGIAMLLAAPARGEAMSEFRFLRPSAATVFLVAGASAPVWGAQFFASQVINTVVGTNQPIAFSDPSQALGGPSGAGSYEGSFDVYKLGNGGSITLGFSGGAITDAPGPDFIVFANPFYVSGNPNADYAELSFVEVSTDGVHFVRFPDYSSTISDPGPYGNINPGNISGFAGVTPVYANTNSAADGGNDINPFDPTTAGGDAFSLSTLATLPAAQTLEQEGFLNLNDIQYARIVDVVDGTSADSNGKIIYCPGSGADVDAIAVISGVLPSLTWSDAGANNLWDTSSTNWNNGSGNSLYTDGCNVIFNDNNNHNYAVTLNTTVSPSSVIVNNSSGNYSISGTGTIGGTGSLTKSGSGALTLSMVNTYSGGTTVNAGTLVIGVKGGLPDGGVSITGGMLQLGESTGVAQMTSLSITGNGTLDIRNDRIIIDYGSGPDPIASIEQWIHNGYYGLPGPSIISSDVATDDAASGFLYGIGYADGADGVVAGLPSGEIEIMFTLLGDGNLDGQVNAEDFTLFSQSLGETGMWDDGDFNYDGSVNAEDFTLFSHNLGQSAVLADQAGVLEANDFSLANVPEPASAAMLLTIIGSGILRRRRQRKAFTLVELLVVIGIIAIMVGLLLPALAASREASNSTVCQSNLRQIVTACINYAGDWQGYWPPASVDIYTDLNRWHGTRPNMNTPFNFSGSCLLPYLSGSLATAAIRACPDFVPAITSGPLAYEASAGGYGYNSSYIGTSSDVPWIQTGMMSPTAWEKYVNNVPAKMNMILHSASKIAFADAAMGQAGNQLIEYSFAEPPTFFEGYFDSAGEPMFGPSSPSIHFRHRNHANVAWADGHVTSELFTWTYPGLNVYGANNSLLHLGYFGPQDNSLFQRN